MLLLLPSNLATALYRARGVYARSVWIQCAAMLAAQMAQALAIVATGRLIVVVLAFIVPQVIERQARVPRPQWRGERRRAWRLR